MIQSHLQYGLMLWGHAHQKYMRRLVVAQKKAVRAITRATYNETTTPLFKSVKLLKLTDLMDLNMTQFMYKFVNKELPAPLLRIFDYHGDCHHHSTRHSADPKPPKPKSDIMARSFLSKAPNVWMHLNIAVKNSNSMSHLKTKLKKNMLATYCVS